MKKVFIIFFSIILLSLISCNNINDIKEDNDIKIIEDKETKYYNVIFYNYDESLLYETKVEEGVDVFYPYDDPIHEEDIDYTYTFIGWDKDLSNIKEDLIIHALFEAKDKGFGDINWF